jgi:uncharacterized protein (DUF58 family)
MLSPDEVRRLDRLALDLSSAAPVATAWGRRVARARGAGLEFHDFRRYQPGDDPRAIDWTIYGRLRQLVVREFRADAHLQILVVVDQSASMSLGTPDKLSCAKKLASLLGYVAVRQQDAFGIATFDATIQRFLRPARGQPQLLRMLELLDHVGAQGQSSVTSALVDLGALVHGPGLVVVMSDFFDPAGTVEGVRYLTYRGLTPALVQIVAAEEINPEIEEAELIDVEDRSAPPLWVDPNAMAAYRRCVTTLSTNLREFCLLSRLRWLQVTSSCPFEQLLQALLDAGLVAAQG